MKLNEKWAEEQTTKQREEDERNKMGKMKNNILLTEEL